MLSLTLIKLYRLLLSIGLVSLTSVTPLQSCFVFSFLNRTAKHLSTQTTETIGDIQLLSDKLFLEDLTVLEVLLPH